MSEHPLTRAVPKPGHVPDSLVYDFDMDYDPAYNENPHDRILYQEMLSRLPPFQLDVARPPKFDCGHVVGIETLDLVWQPPECNH